MEEGIEVAEKIKQVLIDREVAARTCENLVTYDPEHEKWMEHQQGEACGWCAGLEKAATEIRALDAPNTRQRAERAAAAIGANFDLGDYQRMLTDIIAAEFDNNQ